MKGIRPSETLPKLDTVENPTYFHNGHNLLLAYEVALSDGGGCAVLEFSNVLSFEMSPMNIDGLAQSSVPVEAWGFTEVLDSEKTRKWHYLKLRYWTISFNDCTLLITFVTVRQVHRTFNSHVGIKASEVLADFWATRKKLEV
jgi:hypothetical protein